MKNKTKNNTILLFIMVSLLYFTSYMTRLNLSAAKAILITDLGEFTKSQLGLMGTALFFSYGLGQIVSGLLSDRFKPESIISCGLVTTILCNILLPFMWQQSGSIAVLTVIWGVNGLAQAFFWPPIVRLISKYTDKKNYTTGVWLVSISSYAATLIIYILVPFEIKLFNWESAFWIASVWAFIVLVAFRIMFAIFQKTATPVIAEDEIDVKSAGADSSAKPGKKTNIFSVMAISGTFFLLIAVAMQGFFKDGLQDWFPTLLSEGFGMDASYATFSNILLPFASIITMSVSTVLFEKVFKNEAKQAAVFFAITALVTGLMIPVLAYRVSAVLLLIMAAFVNSCLHGINFLFTCFAPRRFKKVDKVATMSGVINACSYMGGAVSSYGIGAIAEKMGWTGSLIAWGIVCVIGVVMCVVSLKKWNKFIV